MVPCKRERENRARVEKKGRNDDGPFPRRRSTKKNIGAMASRWADGFRVEAEREKRFDWLLAKISTSRDRKGG